MCAFPDGAAEESEIGRGLHFATYAFLNALFEFGDFGTGVLHGDVRGFEMQKSDFFLEVQNSFWFIFANWEIPLGEWS